MQFVEFIYKNLSEMAGHSWDSKPRTLRTETNTMPINSESWVLCWNGKNFEKSSQSALWLLGYSNINDFVNTAQTHPEITLLQFYSVSFSWQQEQRLCNHPDHTHKQVWHQFHGIICSYIYTGAIKYLHTFNDFVSRPGLETDITAVTDAIILNINTQRIKRTCRNN